MAKAKGGMIFLKMAIMKMKLNSAGNLKKMEKGQTLDILGSQGCWNKNGIMIFIPEKCRSFSFLKHNNLSLIHIFITREL